MWGSLCVGCSLDCPWGWAAQCLRFPIPGPTKSVPSPSVLTSAGDSVWVQPEKHHFSLSKSSRHLEGSSCFLSFPVSCVSRRQFFCSWTVNKKEVAERHRDLTKARTASSWARWEDDVVVRAYNCSVAMMFTLSSVFNVLATSFLHHLLGETWVYVWSSTLTCHLKSITVGVWVSVWWGIPGSV